MHECRNACGSWGASRRQHEAAPGCSCSAPAGTNGHRQSVAQQSARGRGKVPKCRNKQSMQCRPMTFACFLAPFPRMRTSCHAQKALGKRYSPSWTDTRGLTRYLPICMRSGRWVVGLYSLSGMSSTLGVRFRSDPNVSRGRVGFLITKGVEALREALDIRVP